MATIDVSDALEDFDLATEAELDCGKFDIIIRQAAIHNEDFRAAVAAKSLKAKKKSLVIQKGTVTGSYEEDIDLFIEFVLVGWGRRPMLDNAGNPVAWTPENLRAIFMTKPGRVLFGKIQTASVDDSVFTITEEDEGNS